MRNYTGIALGAIPKPDAPDFLPRLQNTLSVIDSFLRDASFGFARIEAGQAPSGGGGSIGGVSDHGELSGLGDDDHAQYALLAGRTPFQQLTGGPLGTDNLYLRGASATGTGGTVFLQAINTSGAGTGPTFSVVNAAATVEYMGGNRWGETYVKTSNVVAGGTYTCGLYIEGNTASVPAMRIGSIGTGTGSIYKNGTTAFTILDNQGLALLSSSTVYVGNGASYSTLGFDLNGLFTIRGSTSGLLKIEAATATTTHTLTWPAAQGAANTVLKNNGSGTLAWSTVASIFDTTANYANTGLWDFTQPSADSAAVVQLRAHPSSVGSNLLEAIGTDGTTVKASINAINGDVFAGAATFSGNVIANYDAGTGNGGTFTIEGGVPTGGWAYDFPANGGTVVCDGSSTVYVLALGLTSSFRANTLSSGAAFQDNTSSSKKLRFILSTAVGNNSLQINSTAARAYATQDVAGTFVQVGNTTASAAVLGKSDLTAQTGNIAATTMLTAHAGSTGMYRLSFYFKTTTAGTPAVAVVKATVTWDDGTAGQTRDVTLLSGVTALAVNHDLGTLNATSQGSLIVYAAASTAITFTTTGTYTGSPQYTLRTRIESLG